METLAEDRAMKKGKATATGIAKVLNKASSKTTNKALAFSEGNWGSKSRAYHASAKNIREKSMVKIIEMSGEYAKISRRVHPQASAGLTIADDITEIDERAQLLDLSDSDSNRKLF
jgi:hypothetical protein